MFYEPRFLVPHAISLVVALVMALLAWRRPKLCRLLYAALFAWACATNAYTSSTRPSVYLEYAPLAISDLYHDFIVGFFAHHIRAIVGAIALAQGAMALGILCAAPISRLALLGATVFLIAIAPLGVGSAFPATLVMGAGALRLASSAAVQASVFGRRHASDVPAAR